MNTTVLQVWHSSLPDHINRSLCRVQAYASRHGYGYKRLTAQRLHPHYVAAWERIPALIDLLEAAELSAATSEILYLDADMQVLDYERQVCAQTLCALCCAQEPQAAGCAD